MERPTLFFLFFAIPQIFSEDIDTTLSSESPSLDTRSPYNVAETADRPCTSPNNVPGLCVSVFQCEKLFPIYEKGITATQNDKQFLRSARCGYLHGAPLVCCENEDVEIPARPAPLTSLSTSPSEKDKQCGKNPLNKNSERIAGGKNSTLGAWPWMTALYIRNYYTETTRFACGGSLIASDWVLTAAHCVPTSWGDTLDHVRLGDLDINSTADGANPIEVKIKNVIKHPNYSRRPVLNDIAILHLDKPVTFTKYIRPICLHKGKGYVTNETIYDKKQPVVAGWGDTAYGNHTTTHLLEVGLTTVSYKTCKERYDQFIKRGEVKLDETVLCSYAPKKDSCQGDSGGPLMFVEQGPTWSQGGIVSYGYECAKEGYPGVYTKVAAFVDWIEQETGLEF